MDTSNAIKLYKYRWIVIVLFGLYSIVNFAQFLQFSIIADIIKKYYDVEEILSDLPTVLFLVEFILFFVPVGYIVENTSLKTTSIICTGLTALGNCLKLLAVQQDRFWLILISQGLCAFAQIFMLIIPSKIACTWFGANEVSTACAIGILGTQIGVAMGSIVPGWIVKQSKDDKIISDGLRSMFITYAIASVALFVVVLLFFRSKPDTPPSSSQEAIASTEKINYMQAIKDIMRKRDFIIILTSLGINSGFWTSYGTIVNRLFNAYFPGDGSDKDLGILTCIAIISGGCFGSLIFGRILDKTHKFKIVSSIVLFAGFLVTIAQFTFILTSNKIGTYITIPIFGFFSNSLMVISYEYVIETTYPVPEAFGVAVLNVFIYSTAIIFFFILSSLFDYVSYLAGVIFIAIAMALSSSTIFLISTDLKRREANIKDNKIVDSTF